jgi:hypothetical protein
VSYSVVFKMQHTDLPPDVQERARLLLDEIGETCSAVPRDDAFWFYMKESGLTLTFAGWKFSYRLDRGAHELVVYHCEPVDDPDPDHPDRDTPDPKPVAA